MDNIHIRQLLPEDWEHLRDVRLYALQHDPQYFGSNYAREAAFTPDIWQERLANPLSATFGLFKDSELIGITGILTCREDPKGETALMVMSFIKTEHRGQGYAKLFYEARIAWAKEQPHIKKIVVGHREGNEASRRANQRFGFEHIGQKMTSWPDGQEALEHSYMLKLEGF